MYIELSQCLKSQWEVLEPQSMSLVEVEDGPEEEVVLLAIVVVVLWFED